MTWNRSLSPQIILHTLISSSSSSISLGAGTPQLAPKDSPILTSSDDKSPVPPSMNLAAQAPANGSGCNKVSFQAYFPQLEQGGGRVSFKVDDTSSTAPVTVPIQGIVKSVGSETRDAELYCIM